MGFFFIGECIKTTATPELRPWADFSAAGVWMNFLRFSTCCGARCLSSARGRWLRPKCLCMATCNTFICCDARSLRALAGLRAEQCELCRTRKPGCVLCPKLESSLRFQHPPANDPCGTRSCWCAVIAHRPTITLGRIQRLTLSTHELENRVPHCFASERESLNMFAGRGSNRRK